MMAPLRSCCSEKVRLLRTKTLVSVVKISTPRTVPTMVPRPPDEQGAADHHRGDRVELVQLAVGGATGAGSGHEQQGCDSAAQAEQHVEQHGVPLDVDAGQPGGLRVAADRDGATPERGPVEQHPADDRDQREHVDRDLDPRDLLVEEFREVAVPDDLGLLVRDDLGQASGAGEHRQRGDERHHPAVRDQQSVHQAAAGTDGQGDEHHDDPVAVLGRLLGGKGRAPDRRQGEDRSYRQVDPPAGDDEGHADADHTDGGCEPQDGQGVVGGREPVTGADRAHDAEDAERHDETGVAAGAAAQQRDHRVVHPSRLLRRGLDPRGVGAGGRARNVLGHATRPSITRSRTLDSSSSAAADSWTTSPSRMTRTRSARPSTSSTSLETIDHRHARSRRAGGSAGRSRCGRRRPRPGWARRAGAPGTRAAASGRARPSAGCLPTASALRGSPRRAGRPATRPAPRTAVRSAPRLRKPPREKAASEETVMLLVHRLVEQQPLALALLGCQSDAGLHRGGHRARGAAACRPRSRCPCWPGARRTASRGSPSGRHRPARPVPTISPARTARFTPLNTPRERQVGRLEDDRAVRGHGRTRREDVLDGATGHQLDQLGGRGVGDREPGGHRAAVLEHRDPVADLADLLQPVGDVDDRDALGGQPADDPEEVRRRRSGRAPPTARPGSAAGCRGTAPAPC